MAKEGEEGSEEEVGISDGEISLCEEGVEKEVLEVKEESST